MFVPHKNVRRLALAALLLGLGSAAASAQTLYQTGFEAPTFSAGPFAAQGGWSRSGAGSQTAATIQSGVVRSGAQALQINAALASDSVYYWPAINYDTATHSNSLLSVSWDMLLSTVAPGLGSPAWGITVADERLSYVGALLVSGDTGQVFVESEDNNAADGNASDNLTGYFVAKNVWAHYEMRLNYQTRTFDALVNGQQVATGFAFAAQASRIFADADLTLGKGGASTDRAYFDNYRVAAGAAAIPEPGTLALVATAGIALPGAAGLRQRRCRKWAR